MNITFGLDYDGPTYPDLLGGRAACHGEVCVGPLGFLDLLETHLGLGGEATTQPIRVAQYAARLQQADDGERFYSRSLREDSLGVARVLYSWREELLLAGWQGRPIGSSVRADDLAAVEAVDAGGLLAPGFAERLIAVAERLESWRLGGRTLRTVINEVATAQDPEELPWLWRRVVDELHRSGVEVSRRRPAFERSTGDLGLLQDVLSQRCTSATAAGDGSLVLLTARSDIEASEAVARRLVAGDGETVVLNITGDPTLDQVSHRLGAPSAGGSELSRFRPILQVLPLALALRWEPADPARILEFLTLPVSPLPRFAARRLAQAIVDSPGIGGETWSKAIEAIEEAVVARMGEESNGKPANLCAAQDEVRSIRARIRTWIEPQRFHVEDGMPSSEVAETCSRVAQWLAGRIAVSEKDPLAIAALAAATQAKRLAEEDTARHLTPVQLRRLVDAATGTGAGYPDAVAEIGHVPTLHAPAAVLANVPSLIWWDFTEASVVATERSPWTEGERAALEEAGVFLQNPAAERLRRTRANLQPVFAARRRLVLVAPTRRRGQAIAPHPLWDRIKAAFGESLDRLKVDAVQWSECEPADSSGLCTTVVVPPRRLPRPKRWWALPSEVVLAPREVESFTSLSDFLNHPFCWVLRYKAELHPGFTAGLADGVLLLGKLAHRMIGEVLADASLADADEERLQAFLEARCERILVEDGALLLQPGQGRDRRRLLDRCVRGASLLLRAIRRGQWRLLGTEYEISGAFQGGGLDGRLDVALEADGARRAVVDIKWGGRSHRIKSLAENTALQLALYCHLLKRGSGPWPSSAYLILDRPMLMTEDTDAFPDAFRPNLKGGTPAELWLSVAPTWAWRRAQLDAGLVEMTDGTVPDERSQVPDGCCLTETECRFNRYRTLIGFSEEEQP